MRADKVGKLVRKVATGEFGELKDRAREEFRRLEERRLCDSGYVSFDPARFNSIFTDDFLKRFATHSGSADFVAALRTHSNTGFIPGFVDRAKFGTYIEQSCPGESQRIISGADQILADRFPIFNLGFISYGKPPRWNYDPILKVTAPNCFYTDIDYLDPAVVGDSKVVWEISRFQFVYDLGQAYLLTGDDKYAHKFLSLIHDWRARNRDYHGVNYCSALESAFRMHSLVWGVYFFKDSSALTREFAADIYALLFSCADFVRNHLSRHFAPNTHLFGEAYALFVVGLLFPDYRDSAHWKTLGQGIMLAELDRQFTSDGMHAELSTAYHGYALEFLLSIIAVCRMNDVPLEPRFEERLRQGTEVLTALQLPDGTWPHIGDEDGGRLLFLSRVPASDFRPLLDASRTFLGDNSAARYVDSFWFTGKTNADRSLCSEGQGICLENSGLIVSSSPYGMHSSFQCGKFGYLDSPHSHADMLHLDISVGVDNFLVDPGTFAYTSDPQKRNLYRSAAVHNGPAISLLPLENPDDPFGWLQKPDCRIAAHHKTERSEFHRAIYKVNMDRHVAHVLRAVLFLSDKYWVVCDLVDTSTPVTLEWNFITPSPITGGENTFILQGRAGRLAIIPCLPAEPETEATVSDFAISDDYLSLRQGKRLTFSCPSFGKAVYLFLMIPLGVDGQSPQPLETTFGKGHAAMRFRNANEETRIAYGKSDSGEFSTDADFTLIQLTAGLLNRAVLLNGSKITLASQDILRTKKKVVFADIINDRGGVHVNCVGKCDLMTPSPTERN